MLVISLKDCFKIDLKCENPISLLCRRLSSFCCSKVGLRFTDGYSCAVLIKETFVWVAKSLCCLFSLWWLLASCWWWCWPSPTPRMLPSWDWSIWAAITGRPLSAMSACSPYPSPRSTTCKVWVVSVFVLSQTCVHKQNPTFPTNEKVLITLGLHDSFQHLSREL